MKTVKYSLLFVFIFLFKVLSFAQGCVMCSATLESTKQEGGITGAGINTGVGYLSFFPYLILGFFAFIFYKAYKREKEQQK